jgi:hypothetical protein
VGEIAVNADGEDVNPQLLKFRVLDGNCRQFRRSDTGEVRRVEAEHDPSPAVIRQFDFSGGSLVVRFDGEIRGWFPYLYTHDITSLHFLPFCRINYNPVRINTNTQFEMKPRP